MEQKEGFVKWFSELSNKDINIAGGKGASLSEMYNHKFPVPPGFVVTAYSFRHFLEKAKIAEKIKEILSRVNMEDSTKLEEASKNIRALIEDSDLPKEIEDEIVEAYDVLDVSRQGMQEAAKGSALDILRNSREPPFVAVRSSATTEDLADASFAGQQDTFLNIKGNAKLIDAVKRCFSSLFTARAIYYRTKKGFAHDKSYLAVVVQRMIDSDKSGVMFSVNPVKKDNTLVIESVYGLGEGIVSGKIKPDHYVVSRDLEEFKIISEEVAEKKIAFVRNSAGENEIVKLSGERSRQNTLSTYEIKRLAQYAMQLENHYGKPQDIEFAIEAGQIYIVQSRPITITYDSKEEDIDGEILLTGLGASPGVSSGKVIIVEDMNELSNVKEGNVLVTKMTNPDMVVAMQRASAIVTDEGGLTSHAAIVSREMGIPAVVGTGRATEILHNGQMITVDGSGGKVFEGEAEEKKVEILPIVGTRTKIKTIVDIPDFAERAAKTKCKAVGLIRLEGIIAASGKHPMYYVTEGRLQEYVENLAFGLNKIAKYFEEIWIRSSDLRSDEYSGLKGAPQLSEGNPMLGDHGIRFSLKHPDILKAEILALKKISEQNPDKKFGMMVPQVISVSELKQTKELMKVADLGDNVKIGIMVETPAAVQIINDLLEEGIDFLSFGTNDLTQYTLAIDRNNPDVQALYTELHPAVLNSLSYVIRRAKKYGAETSICGQAASKPEMAKFLVEQGIDSISVNADAAYEISKVIREVENSMGNDKYENSTNNNREVENKNVEPSLEFNERHAPLVSASLNESISPKREIKVNDEVNKDIEEVILQELGGEEEEHVDEEGHYNASLRDENNDIPPLNDSMTIESEHFEVRRQTHEKMDAIETELDDSFGEAILEELGIAEKDAPAQLEHNGQKIEEWKPSQNNSNSEDKLKNKDKFLSIF